MMVKMIALAGLLMIACYVDGDGDGQGCTCAPAIRIEIEADPGSAPGGEP